MAGTEEILKVRQSIIDLDKESTGKAVIEAIRAGASTQDIIEKGMKDGMSEVGRKYEAGSSTWPNWSSPRRPCRKGSMSSSQRSPGKP